MTKRLLTLTNLAACVGVIVIAFVTPTRADNEGYNWQAYDNNTRSSPGGWLAYRHDAERIGCTHKRSFPTHYVVLKRWKTTESWDRAVVMALNC